MKEQKINRTKSDEKCCRTCINWLKLKHMLGAGACSSEEVCKRYKNLPIVVTDMHEVCWCWEKDI